MNKPSLEESTFTLSDLIKTLQSLDVPPDTKIYVYDDKKSTPYQTFTRPMTVVNSNKDWIILD